MSYCPQDNNDALTTSAVLVLVLVLALITAEMTHMRILTCPAALLSGHTRVV